MNLDSPAASNPARESRRRFSLRRPGVGLKCALVVAMVVVLVVSLYPGPEVVDVDAAELGAKPGRYAGRTVRLEGCWKLGFEGSYLDVSNARPGSGVWVDADSQSIPNNNPELWRSIQQAGSARRSAPFQITTIHFRGTGLFESAAPSFFQRVLAWGESSLGITALGQLRTHKDGFGHLGGSKYRLTIRSLERYEIQD